MSLGSAVPEDRTLGSLSDHVGSRIVHLSISVSGALRHWRGKEWRHVFFEKETGRSLTPDEVRTYLLECQTKGWSVIPMGDECEGFDHQTGCPGHPAPPRTTNCCPPWAPPFLQVIPKANHPVT